MVTKKNFDKVYANKVSADDFVKQHSHLIDDKLTDEAELRGVHGELQDEKPAAKVAGKGKE